MRHIGDNHGVYRPLLWMMRHHFGDQINLYFYFVGYWPYPPREISMPFYLIGAYQIVGFALLGMAMFPLIRFIWRWPNWKFVVMSISSIVFGLSLVATFSIPTGYYYMSGGALM
jgi:hypothetical protein